MWCRPCDVVAEKRLRLRTIPSTKLETGDVVRSLPERGFPVHAIRELLLAVDDGPRSDPNEYSVLRVVAEAVWIEG